MRPQDRQRRTPGERRDPAQQLVQHDPRGIDVRGRAGDALLDHLGRHVERSTENALPRGQPRRGAHQPGDPEVGDLRLIPAVVPVEQHVLGFEVAMDDAELMRGAEPGEDVDGCRHRFRRWERPAPSQLAPQVRTLDEIHDDSQVPALGDKIADPHDKG